MYKYETHCHTSPVSRCGKASVKDTVCFYKEYGYDGIFITNHFLDGNINPEARKLPYRRQIDYYFSDYEEAVMIGSTMGIKVFPGVELSYKGTDFLIYGLEKEWYKAHPEIIEIVNAILTSEHFSKSKPDPECFIKGMEVLGGTPEDTFVFEDSFHGIAAGRASGAKIIGLSTTNPEEKISPLCDKVIKDFTDFTIQDMYF